uniref:Peptidase S1 domain-containing protein n=1 Tax=Panagrolaimus davidi TaxID=227884 RepID=A0A914Q711_9BILA
MHLRFKTLTLPENHECLRFRNCIKTSASFKTNFKIPNIEFGPHQIIQLNGNPDIPELEESIAIQLLQGHLYPVLFQPFPSEACIQLGETFNLEQQTCGRGVSPFIDVKENKWNIFGSPWFTIENGKPYLLGFNSFFYAEKYPTINILQTTDFICNNKFVNYEFSCRNFNDSFVENVETFTDESLEEVLDENPSVVGIFVELKGLFNWKQSLIGFGVIHSTNGFIVSSSVATALDEMGENDKVFISSKNHKNVYLKDFQVEINPAKDVSSWHDIAFILSESLKFNKDERATLNENPTFHFKDLRIIEKISDDEIAWTNYDLYPDKVCARAFSDIHCCEFGPEQQICGPDHSERFESAPLFDDHGKFVGIYSTKNQYDHGQNVDVFTRIDANFEWIQSYF